MFALFNWLMLRFIEATIKLHIMINCLHFSNQEERCHWQHQTGSHKWLTYTSLILVDPGYMVG